VSRKVKSADLAMVKIDYQVTSSVRVENFIPSSYVDLSFSVVVVNGLNKPITQTTPISGIVWRWRYGTS
jgi:hypothetical protein